MNESTGWTVSVAIVAFVIGGAVGMLDMKWTADAALRDLRAKLATANNDGKVCCDAAYVAIKYRPDCGEGKP